MRQAITRTHRNVDVVIGKETYSLGMMLPSVGVKKAHAMVKARMRAKQYDCKRHEEVTANVMIRGCIYASVWGFKRNNAIKIVHL